MFAYLRKSSLSKVWEAFKMDDKQQVKEIKTIILATCYTWEKSNQKFGKRFMVKINFLRFTNRQRSERTKRKLPLPLGNLIQKPNNDMGSFTRKLFG